MIENNEKQKKMFQKEYLTDQMKGQTFFSNRAIGNDKVNPKQQQQTKIGSLVSSELVGSHFLLNM